MLRILEPMKAMGSDCVFEGQKWQRPLLNMSMLMLLRCMGRGDHTILGFRSTFRDWAAKETRTPREVAEAVLAPQVCSVVERTNARSDLS